MSADSLVAAVCEAIDPDWNKGAAIVERMSLDRASRVLAVVADWLEAGDVAEHTQNFVPLGYDYPRRDPYPHPKAAAEAIAAETADLIRNAS